ncbi:TetR family transcriptional regulator [Herbiconiux daphne]|uniref:TetR family transcriptional regulator n=1 Tax=Herbiconiux daphne TaxID=2970914 RepID=A0ABT2H598_9MICO|nr:TetR family transcriptional regulator [Herbiconiux daphne]MCS5735114.1 TetR family transcriptional regulator [Herbiconiux daphne]
MVSGQSDPASAKGDGVRDRIVDAAMKEFSLYGIAGARVDRIAKGAKTSKERVYAYFSSKEALYAQTAAVQLGVILEATALDADDLPGYAGRLFDYYQAHPDHYRLVSWGRLELAPSTRIDEQSRSAAIVAKLDEVRRAQREGTLEPSLDPIDVLALVGQIATTWMTQPELAEAAAQLATDASTAARRAAVVTAVERLFPKST